MQVKKRLFGKGKSLMFLQFEHELESEAVCQTKFVAVTFSNVTPFAVTVIVSKAAIPFRATKC